MTGNLLTGSELQALEARAQRHIRGRVGLWMLAGMTVLLVVTLALVLGVEYSFLKEIFTYLKGGLPGEQEQWSVGLLSAVGVLAVAAYHFRAKDAPDSLPVQFIRRAVDVVLPLYAVGIGLIFAAILWSDGADTFGQFSGQLFAAPDVAPAGGGFDQLAAQFGKVFVLGCGGIAIINIYLGGSLIARIARNGEDIARRRASARDARKAIETIRQCQREFARLSQQREALVAVDERTAEFTLANRIAAAISEALMPYEKWLTERQLRGPTDENRLRLPESDLPFDSKEVQKRVAALKAITPKTIVAAFRADVK